MNRFCPGSFIWRTLNNGKQTKDCTDVVNGNTTCPGRFKYSNIGEGWTKVCLSSFNLRIARFCPGKFRFAFLDNGKRIRDCLGVFHQEQVCPKRFKYVRVAGGWGKVCIASVPLWRWGKCAGRVSWSRLDNGRWIRDCDTSAPAKPVCRGRRRWGLFGRRWNLSCDTTAVPVPKPTTINWRWTWLLNFGTQAPGTSDDLDDDQEDADDTDDKPPAGSQIESLILQLLEVVSRRVRIFIVLSEDGNIQIRENSDTSEGTADITIIAGGRVTPALKKLADQLEDALNDSDDLDDYSVKVDLGVSGSTLPNPLQWVLDLQRYITSGQSCGVHILTGGKIEVRPETTRPEGYFYTVYADADSDEQQVILKKIVDFLKSKYPQIEVRNRFKVILSTSTPWYIRLLSLLNSGKQAEIDVDTDGNIIVIEKAAPAGGNPWFFSRRLLELTNKNSIQYQVYVKLQEFLTQQEAIQKYTTKTIVNTVTKPISSQTLGEQRWLDSLEAKMNDAKDVFIIIEADGKITLREDPNDNKDGVGTTTILFTTADRSDKQVASYDRIKRLLGSRASLQEFIRESDEVYIKVDSITTTTTTIVTTKAK